MWNGSMAALYESGISFVFDKFKFAFFIKISINSEVGIWDIPGFSKNDERKK